VGLLAVALVVVFGFVRGSKKEAPLLVERGVVDHNEQQPKQKQPQEPEPRRGTWEEERSAVAGTKIHVWKPISAPQPKDDRTILQGRWYAVSEEFSGTARTAEAVITMNKIMDVTGDRMRIERTIGGQRGVYDGTVRLEATATPKQFDWEGMRVGSAAELHGIYEVTEDTLKVCYTVVPKGATYTRSNEYRTFASTSGVNITYKRSPLRSDKGALGTAGAGTPPAAEKTQPDREAWVQLFNGRDLRGWKTYADTGVWRVQDGVLCNNGAGKRGDLWSEVGDYRNFHCRIEAKIDDGGNSGLFFRRRFGSPPFDDGYEAQINSTHPRDPIRTGSLYGLVNIKEMLVSPNEWFTMDVIAQGEHLVIKVNGKTTVDTMERQRRLTGGHFALQDHTKVVYFRKIEVKELEDSPPPITKEPAKATGAAPSKPRTQAPPAPRAADKKGFLPLFNGRDLTGWKGPDCWKVQNGILVGSGEGTGLLSDRADFRNFHLRAQCKLNQGGNSGIFFRCPVNGGGYEADFSSGGWFNPGKKEVVAGSLLKLKNIDLPEAHLGGRRIEIQPNRWFTYEIIANGPHITVKVNGETTLEVDDGSYTEGRLALQKWQANTQVAFRRIEVKEFR
jgi:uncharacterized protein (TIGR03067 family)